MADSKISQLTPITGANIANTDEFVLARQSTSQNFSVTRLEMFASVPSLSVVGDVTIDTDTLVVDSDNNRVGVATAAPTEALDVTGNIAVSGTVDGRDVSTDGSTLDTLDANAALIGNNLSDLTDAAAARTNIDVDQAGTALALAIALG